MPNKKKTSEQIRRQNELAQWCQEQRIAYHAGILSQERIDKLNAIGFDWGYNSCPTGSIN